MNTYKSQFHFRPTLIAASITGIIYGMSNVAYGGAGVSQSADSETTFKDVPTYYANSPAGVWTDYALNVHDSGTALRKFVDPLPTLCSNSEPVPKTAQKPEDMASKCIPVAVPDTNKFEGSDYYEIGIIEYTEQMHSDLPKATKLRGYVQLNPGTTTPMTAPHFLGPTIVATQGRPVRIMYRNLLPAGDLFLPVDETITGAGFIPNTTKKYSQNRIAIHLHGGDSAWISDGTPHQWISSENEPAGKGVSQQNVPDMWFSAKGQVVAAKNVPDDPIKAGLSNDPSFGDGTAGTLFYTNNESARMMFYHDHASALTRLNVYAGMAAGYLVTDEQEKKLPKDQSGNDLNMTQIPLIIQERTFVPKDVITAPTPDPIIGTTISRGQDAKWDTARWGKEGDLWFPHVYEINQDPLSYDGTNPPGRWDYAGYFWPIFPVSSPQTDVANVLTGEHEINPATGLSKVTTTPEAFGDTPIINGTAYPFLEVEPQAYRFRVLNATNDRTLNLGLYVADPTVSVTDNDPAYGTETKRFNTEVAMVNFDKTTAAKIQGGFPSKGGLMGTGWGALDGRSEGVPDPTTAGPDIIQIGTEGGFLPAPVSIPSTPSNYEYNKRSVTVLNVMERGFYLMPAERGDVVVDFSKYAGKTLILYNDAPTPNPANDPRIDYFTGNSDYTAQGGAPTTLAGYGPNTRTIMQIRVGAGNHSIKNITVDDGGSSYISPQIDIVGGDGSGATAKAVISTTVDTVAVTDPGHDYTNPVVTFTEGGATTQATATATLEGPISDSITITNSGLYAPEDTPTVTITDSDLTSIHNPSNPIYANNPYEPLADTTLAAATGTIGPLTFKDQNGDQQPVVDQNNVPQYGITSIKVDNAGSGYVTPVVKISGSTAAATATLALGFPDTKIHAITVDNAGVGYSSLPTVNITDSSGGTGSDALASAKLAPGTITSIVLTNPGSGYKTTPKINITDTKGAGAIAHANFVPLAPFEKTALDSVIPGIYAASQPKPLVPETAYNAAFTTVYADTQPKISTGSYASLTLDYIAPEDVNYTTFLASTTLHGPLSYIDQNGATKTLAAGVQALVPAGTKVTVSAGNKVEMPVQNKAIQELFDTSGRMNATLGVELPATSALTQTTIPLGFIDPATESIADGETQIWKITHNGVDAHPVHFHLVNVQLINRVGWDGTRKWPTANELGWKETVKMNPLEDAYVAVRAKAPKLPFSIKNSKRYMDPSQKSDSLVNFTQIDPITGNPATVKNKEVDFGWEYMWHCHILGHEENDFMRPFIFTGATNYNTADATAPDVTAKASPQPASSANQGWINANATVAITAVDNPAPNGSGIASITYSASGAQATATPMTMKATDNVTYSMTANDVISTEGTTTVTASATDQAATPTTGTLATPVTVKLDKTVPTTAVSLNPPATKGWNNTAVTATFTAKDPLSNGVASGIAAFTENNVQVGSIGNTTDTKLYSADGITSVVLASTDVAGNKSVGNTAKIQVDLTKPTITGAPTPVANVFGWNNANVTVNWTVADPKVNGVTSGIALSPPATVLNLEGKSLSATGKVTDNAGNANSATVLGINIDKTPPVVAVKPLPNANGWYNKTPLTLDFSATTGGTTDVLSGVNTVIGSPAFDSPATTSGKKTFTAQTLVAGSVENVTATDKAGNSVPNPVTVKIDTTLPTIAKVRTPAANANGWNNAPVTVTYTGNDTLSGVASTTETITGTINGLAQTSPVTVAANPAVAKYSTSGTKVTIYGVANDKADNVSLASGVDTINIDTVAPTATIGIITVRTTNIAVTVPGTAADALSGLDTAKAGTYTITATGGGTFAALNGTFTVGSTWSILFAVNVPYNAARTYTVSVTVYDKAGNLVTITKTFK